MAKAKSDKFRAAAASNRQLAADVERLASKKPTPPRSVAKKQIGYSGPGRTSAAQRKATMDALRNKYKK